MKPNHYLTRLRQDIRKMRTATSPERFERFYRFARAKIFVLRTYYKAGQLNKVDTEAFAAAVTDYMEVAKEGEKLS